MKPTKKQREYAIEMDAVYEKVATNDAERDARDAAAYAKHRRTHGGLFQDSYGDLCQSISRKDK